MLAKIKVIHKTKSGFFYLLTATVGLFLYFLYTSQHFQVLINEIGDDLQYFPDTGLRFPKTILDENFEICFFESFALKEDVLNSSLKELFSKFSGYQESIAAKKESPLFTLLTEFADLMSALSIGTVLLDPGLLFCMLSSANKNLLLRRNYRPQAKSNSTVAFGIRGEDADLLHKVEIQAQLKLAGFSIELIQEPITDWMKSSVPIKTHFTSHVFFRKNSVTMHVVVLYEKGFYLWHAQMKDMNYENIPPIEELNFVEHNSAYDSMTAIPLELRDGTQSNISIPSSPPSFLLETTSSRFLECNSSVVASFTSRRSRPDESGGRKGVELRRFERWTVVAIRELKARLDPLLVRFWIWSGTLLGWYRQCGVIPYTSDVDFGAWASDVDGLDKIVDLFVANEHLLLKERMGLVEQGLELNLNCHKVRVDLFFLYPQSNGSWYAGHRPSKGYYFKYHHPAFTLCSAELLKYKVLVPCESEDVISTEYGPDWLTPVTKWNYEKSIKNRGPNIYWDKNMLKKAYSF